jgi:hypothetical protein
VLLGGVELDPEPEDPEPEDPVPDPAEPAPVEPDPVPDAGEPVLEEADPEAFVAVLVAHPLTTVLNKPTTRKPTMARWSFILLEKRFMLAFDLP